MLMLLQIQKTLLLWIHILNAVVVGWLILSNLMLLFFKFTNANNITNNITNTFTTSSSTTNNNIKNNNENNNSNHNNNNSSATSLTTSMSDLRN